jgi:hypothetical protein
VRSSLALVDQVLHQARCRTNHFGQDFIEADAMNFCGWHDFSLFGKKLSTQSTDFIFHSTQRQHRIPDDTVASPV